MKLAPKKVYFALTRRNPIKIADESRSGGVPPVTTIPSQSFAFEEDGSIIEIRYAVGEKSIYPDEQSNRVSDKSVKDIIFSDGFISVNSTEKSLIKYLRESVYNEANNYPNSGFKTKFKEYNQEHEADKMLSKERKKDEASQIFFELMENQHRAKGVLRKLGVTGNGFPVRMMKGLDYVKKNPSDFIELMANPQEVALAERIEYLFQAEQTNIISYQLGKWNWEGAGEIIPVVKGENPHSYLANWTFESKEGQGVWARIKEVLDKNSGEEKVVSSKPLSATEEVMLKGLSTEDLFEKAKNKEIGAITFKSGKGFTYTDLDEEVHEMGKSKILALEFIDDNSELKDELERRIADLLK